MLSQSFGGQRYEKTSEMQKENKLFFPTEVFSWAGNGVFYIGKRWFLYEETMFLVRGNDGSHIRRRWFWYEEMVSPPKKTVLFLVGKGKSSTFAAKLRKRNEHRD
jgi:hypothetical protein